MRRDGFRDEWMRNLLANRPGLSRARLERTRDRMNAAVRDCLVEGYEPLIATLSLPDPDDRHVLAAAIAGRAEVIVTFNLRDFPVALLQPYGIEAWHPADFVLELLERNAGQVCRALREQRARLLNPPQSVEELLGTLRAQGLAQRGSRCTTSLKPSTTALSTANCSANSYELAPTHRAELVKAKEADLTVSEDILKVCEWGRAAGAACEFASGHVMGQG